MTGNKTKTEKRDNKLLQHLEKNGADSKSIQLLKDKLKAFEARITTVTDHIEAMERSKALVDFTTQQTREATLTLVQSVNRITQLSVALQAAQHKLDTWPLSRPEKSEDNQKKMDELLKQVRHIEGQITRGK